MIIYYNKDEIKVLGQLPEFYDFSFCLCPARYKFNTLKNKRSPQQLEANALEVNYIQVGKVNYLMQG